MNCCKQSQSSKENDANHEQRGCGKLKHMLMMLACCLTPLGVVLFLKQSGYDGAANYLVLLLCPLMHLFMMRGMGHKQKESSSENNT